MKYQINSFFSPIGSFEKSFVDSTSTDKLQKSAIALVFSQHRQNC